MAETKALGRFIRISPRKARMVADLIKGRSVEEAILILKYTPKKASRILEKIVMSAVANAENRNIGNIDELRISEIQVNEGPTLRRFQVRALGRSTRIRKRTSHIKVILKGMEE